MLSKSNRKGLLAWVLCLGVGLVPVTAYALDDTEVEDEVVSDNEAMQDDADEGDSSDGVTLEIGGFGFTIVNAAYKSQSTVSAAFTQASNKLDAGYTVGGAFGASGRYEVYENVFAKALVQGMVGYNISDRTPRATGYKFVPFGYGVRAALAGEACLSGDHSYGAILVSLGLAGTFYRTSLAPGGRPDGVRYVGNLMGLGPMAGVAIDLGSARIGLSGTVSPVYGTFHPCAAVESSLEGVPTEVSAEILASVRRQLTKELMVMILKNGETKNAVESAKDLMAKTVAKAAKNQTSMECGTAQIRRALMSRGRHATKAGTDLVNQKLMPRYEAAVNAMVDECIQDFYATYEHSILEALETAVNSDRRSMSLTSAFKGLKEIAENYHPQPLQQINAGSRAGYQVEGIAIEGKLNVGFDLHALIPQL